MKIDEVSELGRRKKLLQAIRKQKKTKGKLNLKSKGFRIEESMNVPVSDEDCLRDCEQYISTHSMLKESHIDFIYN